MLGVPILCRSGTREDFGEEALLTELAELYSEKGLPQERATAAAQKDRQAALSLRQVACKTMADKVLNIPKEKNRGSSFMDPVVAMLTRNAEIRGRMEESRTKKQDSENERRMKFDREKLEFEKEKLRRESTLREKELESQQLEREDRIKSEEEDRKRRDDRDREDREAQREERRIMMNLMQTMLAGMNRQQQN